jgi:hypothetical protein
MFVSFNFPCHLDWLRLTSTDLDCTILVSQSAYQVHTACIWRKGGRISPKISTHALWSTAGGWHSSPCASIVNMLQSHFMGMALLGCNEWNRGSAVATWICAETAVRWWECDSNVLFEHRPIWPIWMLPTSSHVSSWHSLRVATHRETVKWKEGSCAGKPEIQAEATACSQDFPLDHGGILYQCSRNRGGPLDIFGHGTCFQQNRLNWQHESSAVCNSVQPVASILYIILLCVTICISSD